MRKNKLVEPLVWNQRTGNLVGGHQRLDVLDDMEGGTDYELTVSAIDVDDKKEREINVALNNVNLMGSYDQEMLEALLLDMPDLDLQAMAFDPADVAELLPAVAPLPIEQSEPEDEDKIAKIKQDKKDRRASHKDKNDAGYFVVMVFSSRGACDEFLSRYGLPTDQQYIDGESFAESIAEHRA